MPTEIPMVQEYTALPILHEGPVQERKEEIKMDLPWSAFGQMIFVQEMAGPTGEKIKKIAAVSMSYPAGVRSRMGEQILQNTLGLDFIEVHEWDGVEEGKLQAVSKEMPEGFSYDVLPRFIAISGDVIATSHTQKEHEYVRNFFDLQEKRQSFLPELQRDVVEVLSTPTFLQKNAFESKFEGKGLYRLEMYMDEGGVLLGVAPTGEVRPVVDIAADEPHRKWLEWLQHEVAKPGSRIIGHVDDTETVHGCGGQEEDACAEYFKLMGEDPREKVLYAMKQYRSDNEYAISFIHSSHRASRRIASKGEEDICAQCKKSNVACVCESAELAA